MIANDRPTCYPAPPSPLAGDRLPLLDVLTSPVPSGRFDSPVDHRHVLCLHVGGPVPVTYRVRARERPTTRLHGQFCVVPAGSSTRWTLTAPARSLLLRLAPTLAVDLAPAIHVRDPQIEQIGWMMQAEDRDGYPSGRLFADSLATALAARLVALETKITGESPARALPAWRLRRVVEFIEANLDRDLTLAELATVAGFSPSHFKPLFRAAVGMPAHRFVLERRVERARDRLLHTEHSITEIALETGFAHPSHLARWMRRILGTTPSALRR